MPDGTIDTLLADPSGALTDILLYHVVVGEALSSDLKDGMMIETVGGGMLKVSVSADGVMINGANVVTADIMTSNGVIHVIDAVLVPGAEEEMAEEAMATETPAAEEEMAEATPTPAAEEEMAEAAMATETPAAEEEMAEATATPAAEEEMAEAAMATETPAAEEEMAEATPTPAAEEEMAEAAMATGTPAAEEEMAPEMLPVTGGSQAEQSTNALTWVVVVFAAVVAGAVMFFRRRVA
ncbi:MAG: fasciclin domain-containing protein [Caldilineaceae bacterium]